MSEKIENTFEILDDDQKYYFETAPVSKSIFHMVLPMLLSLVATLIFNMTDGYFIGKLGSTAMMAAVTLALPVSAFQMAIGNFFGTGGGTFVSRLLGEGNIKKAKGVSSSSFFLGLFTAVLFALGMLLAMDGVLDLIGASGVVRSFTKDYLMVLIISSPIIIPAFTLEEMVRAEGASKVSMAGMLVGVTVNLILDPIFIFYFKMNIVGAAIATVIGNLAMLSTYMYYLNSSKSSLSLKVRDLQLKFSLFYEIAKTGFSALLMNLFLVVICIVFNQYAASIGEKFIAGFGISQRVVQLADFVGMSFAMGSVPLIAYAFASGNMKRMKLLIQTSATYLIGITAIIAVLLILFRSSVIGLFTIDQEVIVIGQTILLAQLASTLFAGISSLLTGVYQAIGNGVAATILSVARGVLFIPVIILGSRRYGTLGVIWSMTVSEVLATVIGLAILMILGIKGIGAGQYDQDRTSKPHSDLA